MSYEMGSVHFPSRRGAVVISCLKDLKTAFVATCKDSLRTQDDFGLLHPHLGAPVLAAEMNLVRSLPVKGHPAAAMLA